MILSDRDIKIKLSLGEIGIVSPMNDHFVNIHASSMDLRLGYFFKVYDHAKQAVLDPFDPASLQNCTKLIELADKGQSFIVQPQEFVLGVTLETIKLPDDLVARVEGRSSLGRLGIIV
ncbi:MAG: deoxycytidine triphosphate deaminase, dCTP deaminase, partial [Candidatus Peregrinibacteria bacterium GW2011_GWE2_39_6]